MSLTTFDHYSIGCINVIVVTVGLQLVLWWVTICRWANHLDT